MSGRQISSHGLLRHAVPPPTKTTVNRSRRALGYGVGGVVDPNVLFLALSPIPRPIFGKQIHVLSSALGVDVQV